MIKKNLIFLFIIIFIVSSLSLTSAFYTKSHIAWTVDSFQTIQSSITQKCRPYLNIVLDGNTGTDIPVLHYGDNNLKGTYISTHTAGSGYQACLKQAGADVQEQCFCVGNYLHILQDSFSHNPNGLTVKYIAMFLGTNYYGHMVVEKDFENKHMELLTQRGDYSINSGQLNYYNGIVLNSLFPGTLGGDAKYLILLKDMSGLDMSNDAQIFRSGYLDVGFNDLVYKDKVGLPWWANGIAIGLMILGLGMTIFIMYLGKSRWKYFTAFTWFVLFLAGILVFLSLQFNFPVGIWKIVTFTTEVPASVGYLAVSNADVIYYDNAVKMATDKFLTDGLVTVDDASGLDYINKNGIAVKGALNQAELGSKFLLFGLILLYLILEFLLIRASFRRKR